MRKIAVKKMVLLSLLPVAIEFLVGCNDPNVQNQFAGFELDGDGCVSASASVVGLSNTSMQFTGNANIGGSIVLLGNSTLRLTGNASVRDLIYAPSAQAVSKVGQAKFGGVVQRDFSAHEGELLDFVGDLGSRAADESWPAIDSSEIFMSKGGLNIVRVAGGISLAEGSVLTFRGDAQDRFIIQVAGDIRLTGNASIKTEGGISSRNLLFILTENQSKLQLAGNGKIAGTFFAARGAAQISGNARIVGSVFASGSINISGNGLSMDASPFCPGAWVPAESNPMPDPSPSSSGGSDGAPSSDPTPAPSSSPAPSITPDPSNSPAPTVTSDPSGVSDPGATPIVEPSPVDPTCSGISCGLLGI